MKSTEYLLCQGQGVFPLNSNKTTKQRFTMVLRDEFLMLDLKQIVFAVFYDVLVQFAHAYWVFSSFFFNHAPRVFSQWTRTGKPTNDFSWFFNVNLPPQLGPSREDLFIWVEATFTIYKIHSMIHCCSTLNSFFLSNRNRKPIPQEIHFPRQ